MLFAPYKIYLQILDEKGETPDEITWSIERIHDTDAMYTLFPTFREPPKEEAELCHVTI